jgi:hypothetical protein
VQHFCSKILGLTKIKVAVPVFPFFDFVKDMTGRIFSSIPEIN